MNPASANAWPGAFQPGTASALGVSQGMSTGPGLVVPMAGQGCGQLETSPAAAWLGQGLTALGADMGCWAVGSPWGLAGTVRAGACHQGFFVKFLFSETFLSSGHGGLLLPLPQHSLTLLGCKNSLRITLAHWWH